VNQTSITASYTQKAEEFTLPPVNPQRETKSVGGATVMTQQKVLTKNEILEGKVCPECKTELQIAEGCMLCLSCGFSACSV
jgi:hypothetical protein